MRPHISGRKTMGTLEAHANGLRFRSKKQEVRVMCMCMCVCCMRLVWLSRPPKTDPLIPQSLHPSTLYPTHHDRWWT